VFGGWQSVTPAFDDRTWSFDPNASAGSRWTLLSAVMSDARAYIMTVAVGSRIYAMGGDIEYTGSDIVPTDLVEVLDTSNPTAWTALSPMPVAQAEGQGFSALAPGLPEYWQTHVVVAGGGDWPDVSAECMSYDIEADSWNQGFPDLITARRNHAGVFVPLCTSDPDDGLPGLWIFGGRTTGDDPPYGDPEFYPIECSREGILLVDDDWDFEGSTGGGLLYYATALDDMALQFDPWEVQKLGLPHGNTLHGYDAVIWFTGYDWETPITSREEALLQSYLDTGGRLFLSSQEYHYHTGTITGFMQAYLGIGSITDDVTELDPAGHAGDPIGNGLGPYTMVRPDNWEVYWPAGAYEGPYDDYVYAVSGAGRPFDFQTSGEPNSTWMDGGSFKTVYLAWPLEWIGLLADRVEILTAILDWFATAPTPTPVPPTNTPVPPTHTPMPPTDTPLPPTPTVPTGAPTNTPVPPTNTPVPPTDTPPVPPTDTPPVPPTDTPPVPPTDTPVEPTSTPDCTVLGCEVDMPKNDFTGGDECYCDVYVCNPGSETYPQIPVFVILDVYGLYFFAPSFGEFDYYLKDITPGKMTINVLPSFTWPSGVGSASGILWYAAMTDAGITALFGELGIFSFGWH
ncbi:hypothetical protein JXA40_06010, partial [bacterium]|nr:hypothetical protein [candidate division CSSED10-310 bacterium]